MLIFADVVRTLYIYHCLWICINI